MSSAAATILWFVLVMVLVPLQSSQQTNEAPPVGTCNGAFDFYFIIDSSTSVAREQVFQKQIIPLVKNITMLFVNPLWKVSYTTFSHDAVVHLNLTANRNKINQTLDQLKSIQTHPGTFLAPALNEVHKQLFRNLQALGVPRASVILVITDGKLNDFNETIGRADRLRKLGGAIYTIGVGKASTYQLSMVANRPSSQHVFFTSNPSLLVGFVSEVLRHTCIELIGVSPDHVCIEQAPNTVKLTGKGFNSATNNSAIFCRFKINSSSIYDTKTHGRIEYDSVNCLLPTSRFTGLTTLEISLNGISVVSSNVVLNFSNCSKGIRNGEEVTDPTLPSSTDATNRTPTRTPETVSTPTSVSNKSDSVNLGVIAGAITGALIVMIILILFILWYCWLIIRKVQYVQRVKPSEPEKEPSGPKKWATVDASYYGGGGVGGIKQVQVQWGRRGSTEEGSKLTKSKDATVLEVIEEESSSRYKHKQVNKRSCCDLLKLKFSRLGHIISSYRPVRAEKGHIVWCPGPGFYVDKVKLQRHAQKYSRMRSTSVDSSRSSSLRRDSVDLQSVKSSQSSTTTSESAPPQLPAPPHQRPAPPPQRPAPPPQRPAPPPQRPAPPTQKPARPTQRPAPPTQESMQKSQRRSSAPASMRPKAPPRPPIAKQLSTS